MKSIAHAEALSNEELQERLLRLRAIERRALSALLLHLAELERRWAKMRLAWPSLFVYCTQKLGYSESAAFKHIYACRVAARFPILFEKLDRGETHLSAILTLGPILTPENCGRVLAQASGKTKLDIKFIAASLAPKADAKDSVRILHAPERSPIDAVAGPSGPIPLMESKAHEPASSNAAVALNSSLPLSDRHRIDPLSAARVRFIFTGSRDLLDLVRRAQDLLRHKYPAGELEKIFADALDALLEKKDPDRRLRRLDLSGHRAPDPSACDPLSRRIPQAVRDAVWRRDGGQCVYVEPGGERCPERGGLEFDHVVPHALGGPSNNPKNIRLLCRAHNRAAAARLFGEAVTRHWDRPLP